MSAADYEDSQRRSDFDPWVIVNAVRRRLPVFGGLIVVCLLIAFGLTSLQKPLYTSVASILIDPRHKEVVASTTDNNTAPMAAMDLDTQVSVLKSTLMAKKVADRLNLATRPEYKFAAVAPEQILVGQVDAQRAGSTYVINLSVTTRNPKLSAELAQGYADAYLDKQIQDRANANDSSLAWLNNRLTALRTQVESDDSNLQAYKISHNLMSAQGSTLAEQEISSLSQRLADARAELSEKRARRDAAISHATGGDVAESLSTDLVRSLRKQRTDLTAELAKLRTNYGPKYPDVIRAEGQLADVNAQLDAENKRAMSSLNTDVRIAEERYASILGSREDASTSLRSNNVAEVGLMELQRKADASHAVYESFLNRAKELTAQIGMQQPDASVIENAKVPYGPSSPNLKMNLALGLLVGLLLGGAWVAAREMFDHTYKSGRDVSEDLGLKNLAAIPLIDLRGPTSRDAVLTYVLDKPYSLFSEAIRSLRSQISLASKKSLLKVIAVTSALPAEGKTLVCLSLARAMAANGQKVLLIDADLRRSSLTKYLKLNPTYGIQDVFERPQLISQSIIVDEISGAGMMLVPRDRHVSTEVFTGDMFGKMIDHLRDKYDIIILDTAPVLALSDMRVISNVADAIMLVVRWNKTNKDAVHLANNILIESEANVLGVCLNQVNIKSFAAKGYGDSISYFNDFKEYWSDKNV